MPLAPQPEHGGSPSFMISNYLQAGFCRATVDVWMPHLWKDASSQAKLDVTLSNLGQGKVSLR